MAVTGGDEFDVIGKEEFICRQMVGQVLDGDDKLRTPSTYFESSAYIHQLNMLSIVVLTITKSTL